VDFVPYVDVSLGQVSPPEDAEEYLLAACGDAAELTRLLLRAPLPQRFRNLVVVGDRLVEQLCPVLHVIAEPEGLAAAVRPQVVMQCQQRLAHGSSFRLAAPAGFRQARRPRR
jgi:hypothetical protein